MPGFELSRFPEPTGELSLLTCSICRKVLCDPMVTRCCQQTYCESCIKNWIKSKGACPYDKKSLKAADGLVVAPAVIARLLNKQKVKCALASKGCLETLSLENLKSHEKTCTFKQTRCSVCDFEQSPGHSCLTAVQAYKQSSSKELDEANGLIRSLRTQIDASVKTIRDLTSERTRSADAATVLQLKSAKPEVNKRVSNNKDLLAEARKFLNSPWMDTHKTPKELAEKVLDVTKEALTTKGDKIFDVTRAIKEAMDGHCMGDWNVYLLWNNIGYVFFNVNPDGFIELKLGKVTVTVYKSFDSFGFSRIASLYRAGHIRDFVVTKTGFDEAATREIEKVTLSSLKKSGDSLQFTDKVTAQLMANYGGVWHAFLFKANFGFYSVRSDKGRFCLLSNAECKILIFQ